VYLPGTNDKVKILPLQNGPLQIASVRTSDWATRAETQCENEKNAEICAKLGLALRKDRQMESARKVLGTACEKSSGSVCRLLAEESLGESVDLALSLLGEGCSKKDGQSCYDFAEFLITYGKYNPQSY
jgi:hypothetical protein